MATTTPRLTYDDLESIPQEREGDRHEVIDGELVVTPSPIPVHQIISLNLVRHLDQRINANGLGRLLYAPVDIRSHRRMCSFPISSLSRGTGCTLSAPKRSAPPICGRDPLSGTRQRDLTTKRDLFARFGVQEYWIVDPGARTVAVLSLVGKRYEPVPLEEGGTIVSRVLPSPRCGRKGCLCGGGG